MLRLLFLAGALGAAPAAQAVVYDNTTTYLGSENDLLPAGQAASVERGNRVTLAGADRALTQLDFLVRIQGAGPATFDAVVRLYANDGAGGAPGTLLWDSGPQPSLVDSGAPLQLSVAVPDVIVPDTFTWTLAVADRAGNPSALGPSLFDPPTIGTAAPGFWERTGPGPADWTLVPGGAPFGARVQALGGAPVPALPGLALLVSVLTVALAGGVVVWRRSGG